MCRVIQSRLGQFLGWCPPTVDGESYGQRFSIFQITIRLRRKASYYFLDPGLKERPPLSLVTGSIQGQPEAKSVHVYVTSVIHNIPHINAVDATVSMRVKVSAFWRDDRLKHMWKSQNVEPLWLQLQRPHRTRLRARFK